MRKILMLCLATCAGTAALAQTSVPLDLTLDQAVKIALDENPTIRIANLEIERYDYVKKETQGALYPNISAAAGYSYALVEQKLGGAISFGGRNTLSGTGNVTMPLFAPGIYAMLKLNKEQMLAAVESARSSRITLVSDVKKAYYNILLAEQSLDVLRKSEQTVTQTVDNTRRMFENGLSAEYDLLTAEVQLSNIKPTIIQTENSIAVAKMMLKMYLSLPQEVDVNVVGTLDDLSAQMHADDAYLSTDVSNNSDLRYIEAQQRVLDQSLKAQRTQRYPTLGGFFNSQAVGQDLNKGAFAAMTGGAPAPTDYKYDWQFPTSIGVQLSIPIFAGFTRTNREKQIKNNISQLQLQRDYAEEGLNVQVRSAISNLVTAREKMVANEKTVGQAQKAYNISNVRYTAGAGTILELNVSLLNLTESQLRYSQAIYDYLSAQADYDQVIGRDN